MSTGERKTTTNEQLQDDLPSRTELVHENNLLKEMIAATQQELDAARSQIERLQRIISDAGTTREAAATAKVVAAQISAVADRVVMDKLCAGVIAYEPVWAIGTGVTASPQQAQEVHAGIRQQLGAAGETTKILYGGSVNPENAEGLFAQPDINGGLIGGASLQAAEFLRIIQLAEEA